MFKKVLFPVIMSEYTEQIIDCLSGLAKNGIKEVLLFHVLSISEMMSGNVNEKHDVSILEKWKGILEENGIRAEYLITSGIPWIEIIEMAEKKDFSFIVLGSHGNTFLNRMFLGSVTENVVHHSQKPVFIFKLMQNPSNTAPFCIDIFRKVLFATDFSESSDRCIPYIGQMMNQTAQELDILHVQDSRNLSYVTDEQIAEFNRIDQERLDKLKAYFEKAGFKKVTTALRAGHSITEILKYEKESRATITILGRKGKSNVKEMLLGGVAETIIHRSVNPVFIVENNDPV